MKKTDMHLAIASYILNLKHGQKNVFSKKEEEDIRQSLFASLCMLESIPEPIDENILSNALANLLVYIVSNGKTTKEEAQLNLENIMIKVALIFEMVEQPPLAEVLDYAYNKRSHPLIRLFKK